MLAETLQAHRLYRQAPDYTQEGAPEVTVMDYARAAFYKTAFPTDAFDVWRMYRADLCERTGLSWQELNTTPKYLNEWEVLDVIRCYPNTAKECATVRVLNSKDAASDLQHSLFVDSARLFYKYPIPIKSIFLSEIGDFMFNTKTSPQCLMLRIDCVVPTNTKLYPHVRSLLTRYIQSGKKLIIVFESQVLNTDPFEVKELAGGSWVEF